jgi:hypothetical protein
MSSASESAAAGFHDSPGVSTRWIVVPEKSSATSWGTVVVLGEWDGVEEGLYTGQVGLRISEFMNELLPACGCGAQWLGGGSKSTVGVRL